MKIDAIMCLGTQFNLIDVQSGSSHDDDVIGGGGGGVGKSKKGRSTKELIETSVSSKTLESRTSSILGTKFLSGLARIEIDLSPAVRSASSLSLSSSSSSSSSPSSSTKNDGENRWRLCGLISHAPSSPHATARDLQFFSINGRPVDLPSVSKVMGDVWRIFDPIMASSSNSGGGRRRPACVLSFALPKSMYDVNISPDKREVMFTEEAAIATLIKEGLMALWSDQTDGKFEANEVESRSNRNAPRGVVCHDDEIMEAVTNSAVSESIEYPIDETLPTVKVNENYGASVNTNDVDDEVDYVSPKVRRRNLDDGGPLVTPSESGCLSDMTEIRAEAISPMLQDSRDAHCDGDSGGVNGCAPPISVETHVENSCQSTGASAMPDRNEIYSRHEQNCSDKKESEQDRRRWEQTRLNFQRIDNAQIRQGLDCILSPSKDEEEDIGGQDSVRCKPPSSMAVSSSRRPASIKRSTDNDETSTSDRFIAHRQPKRSKQQKSQDVSFLDSFAYGSTKPAQNAIDSDCEDHTERDEMENNEDHGVPKPFENRKSSRGKHYVGTTRMIEGRRAVEKRSQSSNREKSVDESNKPLSSMTRSRQSTPLEEQVADNFDGGSPAEMVWNSFSGTQNVIKQSRNARLVMQNTRKYLQTITKMKMGSNRDSDVELSVDGKTAIKEDSTVDLCKEDLRHMSIIGQFNLGFILARCRNQNLWILDQHACDEKYNFERLCKETVIHEQKLIAPLPLELSPSEEHCVLEHEDVFERNGFRFSYDPEKEPRHRLSLTALPYSGSGGDGKKAVQFGKEDVGALCAILGADGTLDGYLAGFDTAGVNAVRRFAGLSSQGGARSDDIVGSSIVRLPKAIAMFANRACRVSGNFYHTILYLVS
jgi:DNA mismatch repair ATPase MutL